jgi:hypothetical protein
MMYRLAVSSDRCYVKTGVCVCVFVFLFEGGGCVTCELCHIHVQTLSDVLLKQ